MVSLNRRHSVKERFKEAQIVTFYSLYIFETVKYVKGFYLIHSYNFLPSIRNQITVKPHRPELRKILHGGKVYTHISEDNLTNS